MEEALSPEVYNATQLVKAEMLKMRTDGKRYCFINLGQLSRVETNIVARESRDHKAEDGTYLCANSCVCFVSYDIIPGNPDDNQFTIAVNINRELYKREAVGFLGVASAYEFRVSGSPEIDMAMQVAGLLKYLSGPETKAFNNYITYPCGTELCQDVYSQTYPNPDPVKALRLTTIYFHVLMYKRGFTTPLNGPDVD